MKNVHILVGGVVAALTLAGSTSVAQADQAAYMRCVRATEVSCGFPYPDDIDAYQECVRVNVPLNCDWLLAP